MQKVKSYVLPIAIVLGLLLHDYCAALSVAVPYIIFSILLLTFTAVDVRKLRFKPLFIWIILFQVVVSLGGYYLLRLLNVNEIIAEGILIGVLCPVAASVAVISTMLGADRETVTSYTVIGNLVISVVAPVYFSFIGVNQDMPFLDSFLQILRRIGVVIGVPFFVALALQLAWPKANRFISRFKGLAFYLWAAALFLTLGQTIHFIFINGAGNWHSILWLGVSAWCFALSSSGWANGLGMTMATPLPADNLWARKTLPWAFGWPIIPYTPWLRSSWPSILSFRTCSTVGRSGISRGKRKRNKKLVCIDTLPRSSVGMTCRPTKQIASYS